ncbi:MAG TPA: hypothetical protein VFN16_10080 [Saccharospirillum sp.]|nr:hypothetical protein [Saccharospirillum sp.]
MKWVVGLFLGHHALALLFGRTYCDKEQVSLLGGFQQWVSSAHFKDVGH